MFTSQVDEFYCFILGSLKRSLSVEGFSLKDNFNCHRCCEGVFNDPSNLIF